jgi:hypothetical protein
MSDDHKFLSIPQKPNPTAPAQGKVPDPFKQVPKQEPKPKE